MLISWMLAAAMVAPLPAPRAAVDTPPRDTLVLAYEFSGPRSEFTRVTLEAGQVYRVEVTGARQAQIRTLEPGVQQPMLSRIEAGTRASGTVAFELRPHATTVYEVRVSGLTQGSAPVRIYWDASASRARHEHREG